MTAERACLHAAVPYPDKEAAALRMTFSTTAADPPHIQGYGGYRAVNSIRMLCCGSKDTPFFSHTRAARPVNKGDAPRTAKTAAPDGGQNAPPDESFMLIF